MRRNAMLCTERHYIHVTMQLFRNCMNSQRMFWFLVKIHIASNMSTTSAIIIFIYLIVPHHRRRATGRAKRIFVCARATIGDLCEEFLNYGRVIRYVNHSFMTKDGQIGERWICPFVPFYLDLFLLLLLLFADRAFRSLAMWMLAVSILCARQRASERFHFHRERRVAHGAIIVRETPPAEVIAK